MLQCIKAGLIPKGLKLELEPTIGNQNQEFLDNWYTNLKDFSLSYRQILRRYNKRSWFFNKFYCSIIEQNMEKEEYRNIEEVILQNEETTKRPPKQQKLKKFNYLNHKPAIDKTLLSNETVIQQSNSKLTYANIRVTRNFLGQGNFLGIRGLQ